MTNVNWNNKNEIKEYDRNRYLANRDHHHKVRLKRIYGITIEQYDNLLLNQKGNCAICKESFSKTPQVDHNHMTDKVRGLLCGACNILLGTARENITILNNAIEYLERYD